MDKDILLKKLIDKIRENKLDIDESKVVEAYTLAYESHSGQKRKSGEDYILHPVEVAEMLIDMKIDTDTVVAGILHDVVEDTLIPLDEIEYNFGEGVKRLVDGVTKLKKIPKPNIRNIQKNENVRKMVISMANDIRVVIIKLADRLHNMRTLKYMSPEKQQEKSKETMEIYAPIAHRIGMAKIKWELEDISFRYLHPENYKEISNLVKIKREEREKYTDEFIKIIKEELEKDNIKGEVTGRPKHLYSIYRKMNEKEKKFADLNDLIAIRVIVDEVSDCYSVFGIIQNLFIPVEGRFKDYIAVPKENGYRSLHTTVRGPGGKRVEIQIRTMEMHNFAEDGVAAHWKYKEKNRAKPNDERYYSKIKKIIEEGSENPEIFFKKVTESLIGNSIFVMTPKEEVEIFDVGSTVLDFAFQIHTQIGYRTIGAKVNDIIVPLDEKLKTGDRVEILTSKNEIRGPGTDWINMVHNSSSKNKIRKWFKDKEFEEKSKEGELILEKEFKKRKIRLRDLVEEGKEDERILFYMKKYNVNEIKQFYYKIGTGIPIDKLMSKFEVQEKKSLEKVLEEEIEKGEREKKKSGGGIKISGTENTMYRFAKCCCPLPGDEIRGYVTRGRGIAIHRENCENLNNLVAHEAEREVEVYWDEESIKSDTIKYEYSFLVKVTNKDGILLEIVKAIKDFKIDLVKVNTSYVRGSGHHRAILHFEIMINKRDDFEKLANRLQSMKEVIEITTK